MAPTWVSKTRSPPRAAVVLVFAISIITDLGGGGSGGDSNGSGGEEDAGKLKAVVHGALDVAHLVGGAIVQIDGRRRRKADGWLTRLCRQPSWERDVAQGTGDPLHHWLQVVRIDPESLEADARVGDPFGVLGSSPEPLFGEGGQSRRRLKVAAATLLILLVAVALSRRLSLSIA